MMNREGARKSGRHQGCPHCGGSMQYDINSKWLRCLRCGKESPLSLYDDAADAECRDEMNVVEYSCPQCGAMVHTTQTNMISYCSFCGSDVMFRERMTKARCPDRIVPFRITREKCQEIYAEHIRRAKYAPGEVRRAEQAEHFHPIYVPFYTYREVYSGDGTASITEHTSDSLYNYTHVYSADFTGSVEVKGELQCACSQFEPEIASRLQFSTEGLCEFKPGYLCGFYAEAPDMEPDKELSKLESLAEEALDRAGSKHFEATVTTTLPPKEIDETELVLLPVWLLAEKGDGRVLYTAINGVDGGIVCDTPVAQKKTYGLALALGLIFALVFMLLNSVIILRGKLLAALCALVAAAGYFFVMGAVHAAEKRKTELQERHSDKRIKLVDGRALRQQRKDEANVDDNIGEGGLLAQSLLTVGLAGAAAFCVALASQVPLLIYLALFCGYGTVHAGFSWIRGLLARRSAIGQRYTVKDWLIIHFMLIVGVGVVAFIVAAIVYGGNMNKIVAGLVSDRGWFPPYLCLCAGVSMLFSRKKLEDKRHTVLFWAELVLVFVTLALMLSVNLQWHFYIAAALMMLPLMVSMARLTQCHNEFVTRPVPFFRGRMWTR